MFTTCHIASIPDREESLKKVIHSVYGRVDKTYIALNGYKEVPDWLWKLYNVKYEIYDNSLGDAAKFLKCYEEESICFILDDDLIVASGSYMPYMIDGIKRYGGAVSLHGKRYDNRPISRYKKGFTGNYRCLNTVANDVQVHLIGTGCMAFDNRRIILDQSVFEHKNMADVLFSRFCTYNGIPMTVLKHEASIFLEYIPQVNTIWKNTKDDSIQTEIINSFLKKWNLDY